MIYYIFMFGFGFIIDKLKNKVIGLFVKKSVKMLKYTDAWHSSHPLHPLYVFGDFLDWIVL